MDPACAIEADLVQARQASEIDQAPDARTSDITSLMLSEQLTSTYAQLMTKRPVLEEVLERLDVGMGPNSLRASIQVLPTVDTQIIEIKVQHTLLAFDIHREGSGLGRLHVPVGRNRNNPIGRRL